MLILEKAKIDAEVERLSRVHRAWQRGHPALRSTITAGEERAAARERQIDAIVMPELAQLREEFPAVQFTLGGPITTAVQPDTQQQHGQPGHRWREFTSAQ